MLSKTNQVLKNIFFLFVCTNTYSATAIFAGGCFWCVQADLEKIEGVETTQVGFDGGVKPNPNYRQVASGQTNYVESVRLTFNDKKIDYQKLVRKFLRTIDVTQANGQFCNKGPQYRSVIFFTNETQKQIAATELKLLKKQFQNLKTQLLPSTRFFPAEDYHQHYAKKNPIRYKYYRWRCGRDSKLKSAWQGKEGEK